MGPVIENEEEEYKQSPAPLSTKSLGPSHHVSRELSHFGRHEEIENNDKYRNFLPPINLPKGDQGEILEFF